MKKHIIYLLCSLFLFLVTSCASVTMLGSAYPARSADAQVDVYLTNMPECEYTEIAIIKSNVGISNDYDIDLIKTEARKLGADAVIITGAAESASYVHTKNYISTQESGMAVVAIKYID